MDGEYLPQSAVYRGIIDHPAAWTSKAIGPVDRLAHTLGAAELAAIDALLAKTRHLRPQEVTRAQWDHPLINAAAREIQTEIVDGRGVVIIRGVTRARYSEDDFERIYWGFGTHWGKAAVQSHFGDRLGHVRDEKENNPNGRKYRGTGDIPMHTDFYEMIGLMSVQRSDTGGYSGVVSALAIHNEIFRTRPDLLEPLYRGYPYASMEASRTDRPVTPYAIPGFCCVDGKVSCGYLRNFIRLAALKLNTTLPADLVEALDLFDAIAASDDFRYHFLLEPGEMLILNNYTTLHSRDAFADSAEHTRHLLRLWLDIPDGRPVVPSFIERTADYGRVDV